jgi:hypothetical protein
MSDGPDSSINPRKEAAMYVQRIYTYPALGKEAELRGLIDERVRSAAARKVRAALSQQLLAPDGPVFVTAVLHDDLMAFEQFRDRNLADQSFQTYLSRQTALGRQPHKVELFDILVPPTAGSAPGRYVHNVRCYPAAGQEITMRATLEDFAKRRQGEGRPQFGLLQQVFASVGPVLVLRDAYRDLGVFEAIRRDLPPSIQAAIARASALSRAPLTHELYEVLVPFSS